jgi:epoxyqueuosine reductase
VKDRIEQRARELGFDACHFTSARPPDSAPQLERWLKDGRHGEMTWIARNANKRGNPDLVLPGARSVVTLACAYGDAGAEDSEPVISRSVISESVKNATELQSSPSTRTDSPITDPLFTPPPRGLIARYARHADYHDILAAPLKELSAFIDTLGGPDTRSLWYVDTGPLLERDLAQRAGLGFVGKHTNLISRRLGNWFFLAEILTTLELTPDAPEKNRCGSCERCLTACPTQAITAPFQLDARRCISYLTIELKGSIPLEFRPALGSHIYGCDDCLAACPWNRFARAASLMRPHERADLAMPDLIELLSLDDAGFKQRFAGTPMLRTKRRGLLRNVCVALGNIADASALPSLQRATTDPEPLIVEHARWAIDQIEQRTARRAGTNPPPVESN